MVERLTILLLLLATLAAAQAGAPPAILDTEPVQGGLVRGEVPPGASVHLDGRQLQVTDEGHFVFGIGRDETEPRRLKVRLSDGSEETMSITPVPRTFDIQEIDGLPPEQVTPPEDVLERIRADARQVARARDRFEGHEDWLDGFQWPVKGRISGVYGSQRILNGEPRQPHFGIDIAAPEGTPIQAPAGGIVSMTHADMYYSGATLVVDHGHGVSTTYLHMSEISVEAGQRVRRGDVLGKVGATGRATGPHLCWRLNWGGTRLDPALLVPSMDTGNEH